jgi:hypothetical protein
LLTFLYFVFKVNFAYVEHGEKKNTLIKLSMYVRDLFPLLLTLFQHLVKCHILYQIFWINECWLYGIVINSILITEFIFTQGSVRIVPINLTITTSKSTELVSELQSSLQVTPLPLHNLDNKLAWTLWSLCVTKH